MRRTLIVLVAVVLALAIGLLVAPFPAAAENDTHVHYNDPHDFHNVTPHTTKKGAHVHGHLAADPHSGFHFGKAKKSKSATHAAHKKAAR